MKKLLITVFALFALMSASSYAMAEEGGLWEKTKAGASAAIEWTVYKSQQGWRATKEGAANLAAWTGKIASRAWDATKKGTHQAAAWTAKITRAHIKLLHGWTTKITSARIKLLHGWMDDQNNEARLANDQTKRFGYRKTA